MDSKASQDAPGQAKAHSLQDVEVRGCGVLHAFMGAPKLLLEVMVRGMVGLGLREAEVLGMCWQWLDPEHRT